MKSMTFLTRYLLLTIVSLSLNHQLFATVKVARMFSDHMVLQRDINAPVWGTANRGEKITVEIDGLIVSTVKVMLVVFILLAESFAHA